MLQETEMTAMTSRHRPVAALLGLLVLGAIPTAGLPVCRGAGPEPEAVARVATVAMHSEMGDYEANLARRIFADV